MTRCLWLPICRTKSRREAAQQPACASNIEEDTRWKNQWINSTRECSRTDKNIMRCPESKAIIARIITMMILSSDDDFYFLVSFHNVNTNTIKCDKCVHPCLLTGTRIWKHTSTVGSVQLLGTFWRPHKKDPLNRLFMASKPYNWGHFRGPHKLVTN